MAQSSGDNPGRRIGFQPKPLAEVATFTNRRLKRRGVLTEEDLKKRAFITPVDVLKLKTYTKNYLCNLEDNTYCLEFEKLELFETGSPTPLFTVRKEYEIPDFDDNANFISKIRPNNHIDPDEEEEEDPRLTVYNLTRQILFTKSYYVRLMFNTFGAPEFLQNLRMIERIFFKGSRLYSCDYRFGDIAGNSRTHVGYRVSFPSLTDSIRNQMIQHPYETCSDVFYFVADRLIMHHKAVYSFVDEEDSSNE